MRKYYSPIYRANEPGKAAQLSPGQWLSISLALIGFIVIGALLGSGFSAPASPDLKATPVIEHTQPDPAFSPAANPVQQTNSPAASGGQGEAIPNGTPATSGNSSGFLNSLEKSGVWNKSG